MKFLVSLLLLVATLPAQNSPQQPGQQQNKEIRVDPAYSKLANETGGQVYVVDRSKAGDISKIVNLTSLGERDALLAINARLDSERSYAAHVDADIARLVVSVTGTKQLEIKRPSGAAVGKNENIVEYVELGNGGIYSIENPEPGEWTLALRGSGEVAMRVDAVRGKDSAGVQFDRFRFVELGGRPGHEGMFPIQGFPLAGRESEVEAAMDGEVSTLHFEFRGPAGEVLNTFRLHKVDEQEYAGKVEVPDAPFVVYAVGVDMRGKRFQRMQSGQFKPQTFRVSAPHYWEIKAGEESTCEAVVTNYGLAGSFRVIIGDPKHLVREVSPKEFQLESNDSIKLTLAFQNVTTDSHLDGDVVLTVELTDTKQTNFAAIAITVMHQ